MPEVGSDLEKVALEWAQIINAKSPTAMRMIKYGFNLPDDGMVGQQLFAGEATADGGVMGAYESGLRAAREALALLGNK